MPLQVQVFARGASSPAFQVGFTSLRSAARGRPTSRSPRRRAPRSRRSRLTGPLLPGLLGPLGLPGPLSVGGPASLPRGATIVCQSPKGRKTVVLNGKNAPEGS